MSVTSKFNGLNGSVLLREGVGELISEAQTENNAAIIYRLSKVLNDNPYVSSFKFEGIEPEISDFQIGLNGLMHTGDYREALDDCGRLRPGYKFINGKIVTVPKKEPAAVKPKATKMTPAKAAEMKKQFSEAGKAAAERKIRPTKIAEKYLIANPKYPYKNIIERWLKDNSPESLKYKLANHLLIGTKNPDAMLGISDMERYARLLRQLESIGDSNHEMAWRTQQYTIAEAEKWAKESLQKQFALQADKPVLKSFSEPKKCKASKPVGLKGTENEVSPVELISDPPQPEITVVESVPEVKPKPANVAKPKSALVKSSADLMNMQFDSLELTGEFASLLQNPAKNMKIAGYGGPKNGKTAGFCKLAAELTKFGNVLYDFADQGYSKSTQDIWKLTGLEANPRAFSTDVRDLAGLDKLCASGDFQYVFIDMINTFIDREKIKPSEFDDRFIKKYPDISFILIMEVTKGGNFKGDQGWTHLVDAIIIVQDFLMESTGRYGTGHFIVWEEGLKKRNPKKYAELVEETEEPETITDTKPIELKFNVIER